MYMFKIFCLENQKIFYYLADTIEEAMKKHLYYLNLSARDENASINTTASGKTIFLEHHNKTYCYLKN